MKVLRTTVVRPLPGREQEVAELLRELNAHLATQPGFVESYELEDNEDREVLGRVAVWESRQAADRAANTVHTIALRARLQALSRPETDRLFEVVSERHAEAEALAGVR